MPSDFFGSDHLHLMLDLLADVRSLHADSGEVHDAQVRVLRTYWPLLSTEDQSWFRMTADRSEMVALNEVEPV
jgi:hypothetical protein